MVSLTKLLLTLTAASFLTACAGSWTAYPDEYENYKKCDPYAVDELQMVFVPGYSKAAIITEDCSYFRREKVSIAFRIFEAEWSRMFGQSFIVSRNLNEMIVTFSFEKKKSAGYSIFGELLTNADLLGATMSKNAIWVHVKPTTDRICDTSLVHELVHASIWAFNNKHGDPDHGGPKYRGWTENHNMLIQKVNDHLCEIGI